MNVSADRVQYRSVLPGVGNSGWQGSIRAKVEQELPLGLTLGASASYSSRDIMVQGRGAHNFGYNISLYKQFLNRRLSVCIDADSFIPVWYRQTRDTFASQYRAASWMRTFHASFSVSVRYTFGRLRGEVKESSLSLGNEDVKKDYDY